MPIRGPFCVPIDIDQHTVADIKRDEAVEARDRFRYTGLVSADHLAKVFGIQASRERRGIDQIAEHHAELTPLGLYNDRGGRWDRGRSGCR